MTHVVTLLDGQPISGWHYQPTVYLSVTYTIANLALQYALAQTITMASWIRALRGDATVRELHSIWALGSGFVNILSSPRSFNVVALAGLAVTLVLTNVPLLQRSSVVREETQAMLKNLSLPIALEFPLGYTGEVTGRGSYLPSSISGSFSDVLKQYNNRRPINVTRSGCEGTCKGQLLGAGYQIQCFNGSKPFKVSLDEYMSGPAGTPYMMSPFGSNFTFNQREEYIINFTAVFKCEATCDSDWTI